MRSGKLTKIGLTASFVSIIGVVDHSTARAEELLSNAQALKLRTAVAALVFGNSPYGLFERPYSNRLGALTRSDLPSFLDSAAEAFGDNSSSCQAGTARLHEAYASILSGAQWALDLMSETRRADLAKLKASLFDAHGHPRPDYEQYQYYRRRFDEVSRRVSAIPVGNRTATDMTALKIATEELDTLGERKKFEGAELAYQRLLGYQSNRNLETYQQRLAQGQPSRISPPFTGPDTPAFQVRHLEFAGSDTDPEWSLPSLRISFEMATVGLTRDWFDEDLFQDDSWRWPSGVGNQKQVDGNGGGLGQVVDHVVFIRKLRIQVSQPDGFLSAAANLESAQRVTVGPFTILSRDTGAPPFTAGLEADSGTVVLPDLTVFGCTLRALPQSPLPNPSYTWPGG